MIDYSRSTGGSALIDYHSLVLAVVALTTITTVMGLAVPFRGRVALWFAGQLAHNPAIPPTGRQDAAKNMTPGNLASVAVVSLIISAIIAFRVVPQLWSAPVEGARAAVVLGCIGSVLLGLGVIAVCSYFPLHERRTARPRRLVGGLAMGVGGIVLVVVALLVVS